MPLTATPKYSHFLIINLSVLFIATSGPLGRYIHLAPPITIWGRCVIGAVALALVIARMKQPWKLPLRKVGLPIILAGILLGGHWTTYFYALQVSSVAIAMLSLFSYPVFTAILEPIILKTPFQTRQLVVALLGLGGLYLLVPDLDLSSGAMQGVLWGCTSALCFAFRNLILKRHIGQYPGTTLMLYQVVTVVVLFWPALLFWDPKPIATEWPWLIILGLLTTAAGHTLYVMSFRYFTVSTAGILSSLQPIFGILLGIVFLNEIPPWNTVIGGAFIISLAVFESIMSQRQKRKTQESMISD